MWRVAPTRVPVPRRIPLSCVAGSGDACERPEARTHRTRTYLMAGAQRPRSPRPLVGRRTGTTTRAWQTCPTSISRARSSPLPRPATSHHVTCFGTLISGTGISAVRTSPALTFGSRLTEARGLGQITSARGANVFGVVDPPLGFDACSDSMGAVRAETEEEWKRLKGSDPSTYRWNVGGRHHDTTRTRPRSVPTL